MSISTMTLKTAWLSVVDSGIWVSIITIICIIHRLLPETYHHLEVRQMNCSQPSFGDDLIILIDIYSQLHCAVMVRPSLEKITSMPSSRPYRQHGISPKSNSWSLIPYSPNLNIY